MIKKRPALLKWNPESVSCKHREAMFQTWPRSCAGAWTWQCKSHPGRTGFEAWRGHGKQLRLGTVRPGKATDQSAALVAVERGHAEKLGLGTMRRRSERSYWWKCSPFAAEGPSVLEMPVPWDAPRTAAVGWSHPQPRRQTVCAAEGRAREVTQAPWRNPGDHEWTPDLGHWMIYTTGIGFALFRLRLCPGSSFLK